MRTLPFALALFLVACGGDELGLDDSDLEADAAVPVDASKDADAGQLVRDSAVDAAAVDGSAPGPELIDGPATCTGGATSGRGGWSATRCLTAGELAGGCVVVQRARNGGTELVGDVRSVATRATYSVAYNAPGVSETLLCTGTPPTADWTCGSVLLGACGNTADQSTCTLPYILEPMPTQSANCR